MEQPTKPHEAVAPHEKGERPPPPTTAGVREPALEVEASLDAQEPPSSVPTLEEDCENGLDDDEDSLIDCADSDCRLDEDGDTVLAPPCGLDCDDASANRSTKLAEDCGDGWDNDCDELVDGADPDCQMDCLDADGDGFGDPGDPACAGGAEPDCDDSDSRVRPGASEDCLNGLDDDCNGLIDENDPACVLHCTDRDADGFGEHGAPDCPNGSRRDCDDGRSTVNPGATEICGNGLDDDCDGLVDIQDPTCVSPCLDRDGDGFGYPGNGVCPGGPQADCDDADAQVHPGAGEICSNGRDDDCDGRVDENDADCPAACIDADGDGYGAVRGADCPRGGALDCDDSRASVNPDAEESCRNGLDDDCDGRTDAEDPDCEPRCIDLDGDGYGDPGSAACPAGVDPDCNDTAAAVSPGADEDCTNGLDDDCDGLTDVDDPDCVAPCADEDGDGFGAIGSAECLQGFVEDCDDTRWAVNPGATEQCGNLLDDDCNGLVDLDDAACALQGLTLTVRIEAPVNAIGIEARITFPAEASYDSFLGLESRGQCPPAEARLSGNPLIYGCLFSAIATFPGDLVELTFNVGSSSYGAADDFAVSCMYLEEGTFEEIPVDCALR